MTLYPESTNIITGLMVNLIREGPTESTFKTIYKQAGYTPYFKFMTVYDHLSYNLYKNNDNEISSDNLIVDLYFRTINNVNNEIKEYKLTNEIFDVMKYLYMYKKYIQTKSSSNYFIKTINEIHSLNYVDDVKNYWLSVTCAYYCLKKLEQYPHTEIQDICKNSTEYIGDHLKFNVAKTIFVDTKDHDIFNTSKLKFIFDDKNKYKNTEV